MHMSFMVVILDAAIFTLRTYAIYGRNRWILAGLASMGVARVVVDMVSNSLSHNVGKKLTCEHDRK